MKKPHCCVSSCIYLNKSSEIFVLFRGLEGVEQRLAFTVDIYSTVQYSTVIYTVQYSTVICRVQYSTVICTVQYSTVICRVQYSTLICTVQYSTVNVQKQSE